jgi:HK97 family phage major capsid protein
MPTQPLKLSDVNASLLPRTITGPIFEKSVEQSAVMTLARPAPLAIDATTVIPIPMDVPVADWVGSAQKKPLSSGGVDIKSMSAKKLAVLIPVSEEVAMTNAGGLYTQLSTDLPTAFARAFDMAAIHGRTMRNATGPFADYLAATSNSIALGTSTQAQGGIWADFVKGMAEVVDNRLKPSLLLATDTTGRPILVDTTQPGNQMAGAGTLIGEPLAYSRSVSGKQRRQSTSTDTGLRAIGGDWSQAAYGVGMDITIRVSKEATYIDEDGGVHSAFQENLVLLLAEAYYGFVMGDQDAFVKYTGTPSGS